MEDTGGTGGDRLRRIRISLRLTLRDVEGHGRALAERLGDLRYNLPVSRLSEIESGRTVPNIFKLFSLALIYDRPVLDLLALYGIDAHKRGDYAGLLPELPTHPADLGPPSPKVSLPIKLDPAYSPRQTVLLNRAIQEWREIPLEILVRLRFERHLFVRIGRDDNLMYPLLRPGSLVQVYAGRQEIPSGGWTGELDRPLYVFSTHQGYRCSWCRLDGKTLTLVPHPGSDRPPETYVLDRNISLVGRVVAVWNVLAPSP